MSNCFVPDRKYDLVKFTFTTNDKATKTKSIPRMSPKQALIHLLIEEKIELRQVTDIEGIDLCAIDEIKHLLDNQGGLDE